MHPNGGLNAYTENVEMHILFNTLNVTLELLEISHRDHFNKILYVMESPFLP